VCLSLRHTNPTGRRRAPGARGATNPRAPRRRPILYKPVCLLAALEALLCRVDLLGDQILEFLSRVAQILKSHSLEYLFLQGFGRDSEFQ
jgi:hypothetical protein